MQYAQQKKVAIVQSNYIPWKGYFDMIAAVDEFILYDDVQYTRRDWRNRNQIKTPQGIQWLSVPVKVKSKYYQKINETEIDGAAWAAEHWLALVHNYRRAPHFPEITNWLEPIYLYESFTLLSELNYRLIQAICKYLAIDTLITHSRDYTLAHGKTERLTDLCVQAGAAEYVSGPAGRTYIDGTAFDEKGIKLTWFNYEGFQEYPQLWGKFNHNVSILDLLFNCGNKSTSFMRFANKSCLSRTE